MIRMYGVKVISKRETIYTVFPHDTDEMPQDFETEWEAIEYGNENYGEGNYTVEATN